MVSITTGTKKTIPFPPLFVLWVIAGFISDLYSGNIEKDSRNINLSENIEYSPVMYLLTILKIESALY